MRRVLSSALPALLALTLAGCGGGAGGPGRLPLREFNTQAAEICDRASDASSEQAADPEALGRMVDELGRLDPPIAVEKEFKVLLRTGRAWIEAIRGQARNASSLEDKFADDARATGLHGCAEAVP